MTFIIQCVENVGKKKLGVKNNVLINRKFINETSYTKKEF